ncbi:MAG: phage holin family protein [Acidobacteria bacterium]|nr:phage holin family protein [Acidobacteriota bacterium]MCA1609170.1 phage holin family protein [Acidobacteriota bacterium]
MAQQQMQRDIQIDIQKEDRSLGDLLSELMAGTGTLVRQEVSLAQAEITQKATKAGKNIGYLAVGGAIGYAGLLAIIAGIIIGLSYLIPAWIAALVVGGIIAAVSFVLITSALTELKNMEVKPTETVASIKEDAQWLKNQVS